MASYIGSRISLTAADGVYEGTVTAVDTCNGRLSLEKVKSCTTNKKLCGMMHFLGAEIEQIEILQRPTSHLVEREVVNITEEQGPKLVGKRHRTPHHLRNIKSIDLDAIFPPSNTAANGKSPSPKATTIGRKSPLLLRKSSLGLASSDSEPESDDPYCGRQPVFMHNKQLPIYTYTLLEEVNEEFRCAVKHLQRQSVIAVAAEGVNMGRKGTLCWVQVATRKHVILFDILALKEQAFEHGLRDVLKNESIQKVIHNCRQFSDLLFHQYGLKMVNIFDTQVADVMVYRMESGGDFPRYVHGLAATLLNHVPDFPSERLYIQRNREQLATQDQSIWAVRPASEDQLDAAAKNVINLLDLRAIMLEKLLADFVDGVDIYLGCMRDFAPGESHNFEGDMHMLPREFANLRRYARHYRQWDREVYDQNGFRENCIGIKDPLIQVTPDGVCRAVQSEKPQNYVEFRRGRVRERHPCRTGSRSCSHSRSRSSGQTSESDGDNESVVALGARRKAAHVGTVPKESVAQKCRSPEQIPAEDSGSFSRQAVDSMEMDHPHRGQKSPSQLTQRLGLSRNTASLLPTVEQQVSTPRPATRARLPGEFVLKAAGSEIGTAIGKKSAQQTVADGADLAECAETCGPLDNMDIIPAPSDEINLTASGKTLPTCPSGFERMNGVKGHGSSATISAGMAGGMGRGMVRAAPSMVVGRGTKLAEALNTLTVDCSDTRSVSTGAMGRAQQLKMYGYQ